MVLGPVAVRIASNAVVRVGWVVECGFALVAGWQARLRLAWSRAPFCRWYRRSRAAETLESALVQAYLNNPSLNSQRAAVRATDENVPQALAGYRPKVSITATGGEQSMSSTTRVVSPNLPANVAPNNPATYATQSGYNAPVALGATITQTLFNGFQTANKTRQAESQVLSARATLRVTEQTVLLNAATAYMNLLRDTAILDLQRRNVEVLQEQLRQTRDRFNVGEVTRTDVAQSESRLAAGRSQVLQRGIQLQGVGGDLSPGDRRRSRQAHRRHAGRPFFAAKPAGVGRSRHRHPPGGDDRAIQRRRRAASGESGRGRASIRPCR